MENKERTIQITLLVVGLIVGFGLGFLVFDGDDNPTNPDQDTEIENGESESNSETEGGSTINTSNNSSVTVSDQAAGSTVLIDTLSLEQDGWVAIYTDMDGQPGSIIGAQYYPAGEHQNIPVSLQLGTTAGNTYYAVLHADDGKIVETAFGRHEFNHTTDLELTDSSGNEIIDSFSTISLGARGL